MDENGLPDFLTDTGSIGAVVAAAEKRAAEQNAQLQPEYWTSRMDELSEAELRASWTQQLIAAGLPPTTLDAVFRYLARKLSVSLGAVRQQYNHQLSLNGQEETHAAYAQNWLDGAIERFGIVFADQGSLWAYNKQTKIYDELSIDRIIVEVSGNDGNRCKTANDYRSIAQLAYTMSAISAVAPTEFPAGLAVGDKFFKVENDKIIEEPLSEKHYAMFKVSCEPNINHPAPLLKALEMHCFADDPSQLKLLKQQFGAALFGEMWRMQKVALWLGEGSTGKSTWQELLSSMFPQPLVSAIPPHNWGEEYHAAGMAGKKLNLVGEIEDTHPLDAAFKNATGGGKIHARHPTHRPFEFVPRAAQFFNGNHLPATKDRGSAFWRRWTVIEFKNVVATKLKDRRLAEKIIKSEMPYLVALAIEGMEDLTKNGMLFDETEAESKVFGRWKRQTNSVEEFLSDEDFVVLGKSKSTGRRELFAGYTAWCSENRRHALGRNKFVAELERVGKNYGVEEMRVNDVKVWGGVAVLV